MRCASFTNFTFNSIHCLELTQEGLHRWPRQKVTMKSMVLAFRTACKRVGKSNLLVKREPRHHSWLILAHFSVDDPPFVASRSKIWA